MNDWKPNPTCPKCGTETEDWWDGLDCRVGDGDVADFCCPHCGHDYKAAMCVTTTFQVCEP